MEDKREGLGTYKWCEGGYYRGEWKSERMNGFGRLVKDGIDILGEFFADHFSRPIDEKDITQDALRKYIFSNPA